jgi:hypothetical protein
MKLTRRQQEVLMQLHDDAQTLEYHRPTNRYVIGSPARGWQALRPATVAVLLTHVLIKFDTEVRYTSRATLTKEGRALARQLVKECDHAVRVQGRCIYCGLIV